MTERTIEGVTLPDAVRNAVSAWATSKGHVGEMGKVSYVYMQCARVAIDAYEAKQPTTEHVMGWHYGYVTCSCGWAWRCGMMPNGTMDTQDGVQKFHEHFDASK